MENIVGDDGMILTHIQLPVPPVPELAVPFHRRVDALGHHILVINAEPLPANIPIRRQALGQRQVDISVAKSALDPLLEALNYIDSCRQAEHGNWRFPSLCDVEKVVEKRLPSMCGKQVKLVNQEYDGFGRHTILRLCYLGGVG